METNYWTPNVATPASAVTVNVPDTVIPQGKAVQYLFISKGNMLLSDITRFRILANGSTIWDISNAMYVAWLQRFGPRGQVINTANKVIPLPLFYVDIKSQGGRYACQAPVGSRMSVQFDVGSITPSGEGLDLLTTFTDQPAITYPTLISSPTQVAAGSTNQVVQIKQNVVARGFALKDAANITRVEIQSSGILLYNGCSGTAFANEQLLNQCPDRATISLDPVFNKIPLVNFGSEDTRLILSTGGGYAGETTEYAIYGAVSQPAEK